MPELLGDRIWGPCRAPKAGNFKHSQNTRKQHKTKKEHPSALRSSWPWWSCRAMSLIVSCPEDFNTTRHFGIPNIVEACYTKSQKCVNASLVATPFRGQPYFRSLPETACWLFRLFYMSLIPLVFSHVEPRLGHRFFLRNSPFVAVHPSGETFEGQLCHGAAALRQARWHSAGAKEVASVEDRWRKASSGYVHGVGLLGHRALLVYRVWGSRAHP